MEIIQSVPQGGNWQDIPLRVIRKSARLTQIHKTGGRTTYYGRLKNNVPSYTINTYFNRPGNGTFIHPEQNRLLSIREAARLQSFPDRFRFLGSYSSRYKQIGNAVPPLLARAVASLFKSGLVVDLFSGAGGLSEGFVQAGNEVILASDFNSNMCKTYAYNHPTTTVIQTDLNVIGQSNHLLDEIDKLLGGKHLTTLIGGPPCQGFSTAGNRNSVDPRNNLIFRMLEFVGVLKPDNVVIENVPGLKWIKHGRVLDSIVKSLNEEGYGVTILNLHAEEFGVPQRRRRVFIVGSRNLTSEELLTGYFAPIIRGRTRHDVRLGSKDLPPPVNVFDAISDLPPIDSGGGDDLIEYDINWIATEYQKLMRDLMSFEDFLARRTEQG
ncbi:MAG: DNA (cytosine-5-)-methyltransferase [Candidatus Sifarchaeia archaeon]